MARVLVLGDDTGACLGAIRSLGRRGIEVHCANSGRNAATGASVHLAAQFDLPRYREGGGEWLARMRELVAAFRYDLILPTSDSSLVQVIQHADDLGAVRSAVPNREAARVFTDKWATRSEAQRLDIPVAPGALIADLPPAALADFAQGPAILKFRRSYECGDVAQKSAVRRVDSPAALERALAEARFEVIERFVPGYCRGLSVLAKGGRVLVAHQHRRLRQEHPTGASSRRVSERCDPRLLEWTARLVEATALTGVAMFEYRCDPGTGRDYLLEVNPRLWGSLPLALAAGADFPALLYDLVAEDREPAVRIGSRPGIEKRSIAGEARQFAESLERAARPPDWLGLLAQAAEACLLLAWGRRYDSWAADDPAPFKAERRALLRQVVQYAAKLGPRLRRRLRPART